MKGKYLSGYKNIVVVSEDSANGVYNNDQPIPQNQLSATLNNGVPGKKYDVSDLETGKVWLVGSKLPEENEFTHHFVYNEKHRQRLWDHYLKNGMHFFILEVDIPLRLKQDATPF